MTELKTLKDIHLPGEISDNFIEKRIKERIRQKMLRWITEIDEVDDNWFLGKIPAITREKLHELMSYNYKAVSDFIVIEFLKYLFNITDEDVIKARKEWWKQQKKEAKD